MQQILNYRLAAAEQESHLATGRGQACFFHADAGRLRETTGRAGPCAIFRMWLIEKPQATRPRPLQDVPRFAAAGKDVVYRSLLSNGHDPSLAAWWSVSQIAVDSVYASGRASP